MDEKTCMDCVYHFVRDSGYSVWTVLNQEIDCFLDANRNFPQDLPVNPDLLLDEDTCAYFMEGEGKHFNVEGDIT